MFMFIYMHNQMCIVDVLYLITNVYMSFLCSNAYIKDNRTICGTSYIPFAELRLLCFFVSIKYVFTEE